MSDTEAGHLLTPEGAPMSPPADCPNASSSRAKRNGQARLSLRPTLTTLKNRFSMALTPADMLRAAPADAPAIEQQEENSGTSDPYWRPVPYNLTDSEKRIIHVITTEQDQVQIMSDTDGLIYRTNLVPLPKASTKNMPNRIQLVASIKQANQARPRLSSNATICKLNGELRIELDGLDPITFFRAKPDCLRSVYCFNARRTMDKSAWRTTAACFSGIKSAPLEVVSITYAWKNTSSEGKGGLKLVDLRDSEVLAYYVPAHGKSFGKVILQGSGLVSQRIVCSSIVALKYRHVMPSVTTSTPRSAKARHSEAECP